MPCKNAEASDFEGPHSEVKSQKAAILTGILTAGRNHSPKTELSTGSAQNPWFQAKQNWSAQCSIFFAYQATPVPKMSQKSNSGICPNFFVWWKSYNSRSLCWKAGANWRMF